MGPDPRDTRSARSSGRWSRPARPHRRRARRRDDPAADHVIDLGPGGGRNGGHSSRRGRPRRPVRSRVSDGRTPCAEPGRSSAAARGPRAFLEPTGARAHNLKTSRSASRSSGWRWSAGVSGVGEEHARAQGLLPGAAPRAGSGGRGARCLRPARAVEPAGVKGQRAARRVARATAVHQSPSGGRRARSRDLPGNLGRDPPALRPPSRVADAGLCAGSLLVQHGERRPLRDVRGAGGHRVGDGVSSRRRLLLRRVRRRAIRACDAGCPLRGPHHRRRPPPVRGGRGAALRGAPEDRPPPPDALRPRRRLRQRSGRARTLCPAARRSASSSRPS